MLRSVEKLSMKKLSPTQLSDNELYIKLQKYGISTGPVTPTTKTVLERKLNSIQCQTELRIDKTPGSIVDFNNTDNKSDMNQTECINGSPEAIHGQNSIGCTENNKNTNDSSLYYGVAFLSGTVMSGRELNCYGEVPPFVFTDKKDALKIIKKYKGSRFKAFSNKEEAINFASRPCDEITSSPLLVPSQCPVLDKQIANGLLEKPSLFKAPKIQEMAKLRKAIEIGDAEYFKKTVWSNPRYLMSNGDTPTIFKEGFRYNAMHIAASKKQAAICHIILTTIEDSEFMHLLYPEDTETIRDQRISFILDLYLNMPEKPLCETPLHFASKFGCLKTVEVLLAHPLCDKRRENIDKKTAKEIICDRDPLASSEYKKQIESLFEERYYVPVLRSDDNSLQPIIGEPLSPDFSQCDLKNRDLKRVHTPSMSVKAIAGPMSPKQAKYFYKKWKTPPRSNAKNLYKIRLGDAEKGLEVVGRKLARESRVSWKEFWPFLDCWCDLSSPEGLLKLENHLKTKHANMDSQEVYIQQKNSELSCTNKKFSVADLNRSNFQDSPHKPEDLRCPVSGCNSPLSHLCHLLEKVSLNRNSPGMVINRTVSCENMSKKPEGKNHLSDVSRVLNFEDCEKKNSLFQAPHITTEAYIKNEVLETNCNLEMENKWTLNSNMDIYSNTALFLLIQNISTSLIDIVLQENSPQKCVVSKDLLDSALPHLGYFYQTVQNDNTNSNLNSIHCDIAKQIATNLKHNLILQEVEQIHIYLKSYLSIACDLSSSDDECLDCFRDWNYKKLRGSTIYKQHLHCIFQFLCSYVSESGSFEEWEEVQVCCCEWKLKTNSNNSLNTDFNFYTLEDKLVNNNEPKDHISVSQRKENDVMDDSSDEEFYTPPSSVPSRNSPKGTGTPELIAFIQGRYPSKADVDAVRALGDTKIDPVLYPHIFQWRNIMNCFPSDVVESFCSPAHKRKVLNQDSFSYNSNYSISPIARPTGCAKTLACMPKNLYETSLSWEESSSE